MMSLFKDKKNLFQVITDQVIKEQKQASQQQKRVSKEIKEHKKRMKDKREKLSLIRNK